jgi:two-component system OmpR family sensor kinase
MAIFYSFERDNLLDAQKENIKKDSIEMVHKLRELHQINGNIVIYPNSLSYQSAIFDIDKIEIFSTFKYPNFNYNQEFFIKGKKLFFFR